MDKCVLCYQDAVPDEACSFGGSHTVWVEYALAAQQSNGLVPMVPSSTPSGGAADG